MAVPQNAETSNKVVRSALNDKPAENALHVGGWIFPEFELAAERTAYVNRADHALDLNDLRAPGSEAKKILFEEGSQDTVSVVERGQKSTVDKRDIDEAGQYGIDMEAERAAFHRMDIEDAREYRICSLVTDPANYVASHKDETGFDWAAAGLKAKIDPLHDAVLDDGHYDVVGMVIGRSLFRAAQNNADVQKFAGGANGAPVDVTLDILARFLEIPQIRLGRYRRLIGFGATTLTEFWPVTRAVMFSSRPELSTRTFGVTVVTPYGSGQGKVVTDARTEIVGGTDKLIEIGAYQRYRGELLNASLGAIITE